MTDIEQIKDSSITKQNSVPTTNLNNISTGNINAINLFDEKQLAAASNFMSQIMRSEKGGIKSVNDGIAILMRAQGLNLPFATAIEHIHVINGKTGIDIHVAKALLLRAGVTWNTINDYTPLYEYTDGFNVYIDNKLPSYAIKCINKKEAITLKEKDNDMDNIYVYPVSYFLSALDNATIFKSYQININHKVVTSTQEAAIIAKSGKIPIFRIPNQPIDYITKYKFERVVNGKLITAESYFTYNEAQQADLFTKDTYKKFARILISHRAFTYGARDIASDVLLGAYETTELKIMTDTNINDGDVIDISAEELK